MLKDTEFIENMCLILFVISGLLSRLKSTFKCAFFLGMRDNNSNLNKCRTIFYFVKMFCPVRILATSIYQTETKVFFLQQQQ